ncbi:hypothetical protein CVT26_005335 [Gymnopilus dilepis]|uniref:Amine oxidase n=1 Tax=Gymnopilus dilepis TaxID=231916 RepID=A0A409YT20_9AGAR|nr:hypothetical protein CVT26_005335 [Gymnopilus dilepis]
MPAHTNEYKPLETDLPDPDGLNCQEKDPKLERSHIFLGLSSVSSWLLCISLVFNFLCCFLILRNPQSLSEILSTSIFGGESWYGPILGPPVPAPATKGSQGGSNLEGNTRGKGPTTNASPGRCVSPQAQQASPPAPLNPWASLTTTETQEIQSWLSSPVLSLNLSSPFNSSLSDNVIFMIEAYPPPKNTTLAYLQDPDSNSPPERYARVTIHHGSREEPVVKDYLVGPLPVGEKTTMRPLEEIYHRKEVPFNSRGLEMSQLMSLGAFVGREFGPVVGVLEELFGGTMRGLPNDTLGMGMVGPFSFDGNFRRLWMTWRRNVAGSWLNPVNFYQYIDTSGTDPGTWKILKIVYHDQIFPTITSFVEAFNNGTLVRYPSQSDPTKDYTWAQRKRPNTVNSNTSSISYNESGKRSSNFTVAIDRDLDDLPGPRSVSFSGVRYRVDKERGYVSWLGWGMYLGFERDMGLGLWDVRFRGERIIYQLAPQEAIAQYGGSDPAQATTAWLDRYFGMGARVRNMIPHYDCPQESLYLPATTYSMLGSVHVERAICIFEQDSGKPLSRHTGDAEGEFGAVKGYVLTVRSFDYNFYLDGTIEVRLSASGYMQGGYWRPDKDPYGGRIHEVSMGNLHDHVINYKVDFDIAGTSNSLQKITTQVEHITYPWLDDDYWGQDHVQQKIVREYIANEDDALLKHPPNFQGLYAVVNQEERNRWGYPRGYAIHPGQSSVHNTVVGSKRLLNNANWARYNLAVSRRKETEPSSSSMWNLHLPGAPPVDFHKFFDGESLTQEDLVAWINVGMHHLPQAEDSPNTKTNIATSSFILTPLNYFDYDVSMELKNAILLHEPANPGELYSYDDYGVKQDFTCLPESPAPLEYGATQWLEGEGGSHAMGSAGSLRDPADMYLRFKLGA